MKRNQLPRGKNEDCSIRCLIVKYREDDESAFDELVKLYAPLIDSLVYRYRDGFSAFCDADDIRQYAMIAFAKAIMTYNLEQNSVSFGLYAKLCIFNTLSSRLRDARRENLQILPIEGVFNTPSGEDVSGDVIAAENARHIKDIINKSLTRLEARVFEFYAEGYSAEEISEKLGKSEKSVENAVFRARRKLKAVLSGGFVTD